MSPEVTKVVNRTSVVNAVIAVVLSPIPLADELVFLPGYAILTAKVARVHGVALKKVPWKPVMRTAIAALAARAAANVAVSYIPGVAAVANAISAVALTQFFGRYVNDACKNPSAAQTLTAKDILASLRSSIAERFHRPA